MKRSSPLEPKKFCRRCRSTLCRCGSTLKRGAPLERKTALGPGSAEKREERHRRQYGSDAWVEHLHGLPCDVCGVSGWTQAAHTATGGTGMKAGPETLAPLCGNRLGVKGCHEKLDEYELEDERPRLQRRARERWSRWSHDGT